jgi:multiple sugar transport system permease protein
MERQSRSAYLFIALPMAILVVFTLVPTVAGLGLSLFTWDGAGEATYVGLGNFAALAQDQAFWPALRNTLLFVVATVPISVLAAFGLAVIASAPWFRGRTLARTCIFLPTIVSIIAVGVVWRWLLADQGGLVPGLLRSAGVRPPQFLEGSWAMASIIIVQIWRGVGFCFVLYLAALAGVNRNLYEAARVDGASRFAVVRHITWPSVSPMTLFLMVTGVIGALQVFDVVWAMTSRAETDTTRVLNLYIFREFEQSRLGYAAAIGVVIFVITMVVTLAQIRLLRSKA